MVTKESLQSHYANLETSALLEIITQNSGYTELAVSVALDELKFRNVAPEDIEIYQETDNYQPNPLLVENYLVDLTFAQKFAFYVFWIIWIPRLRVFVKINFREDGYILKSNQMRYYAIAGFSLALISMICNSSIGDIAWFVWIGGFIVAYTFDNQYNKDKQIKKLENIMESHGNFEWD